MMRLRPTLRPLALASLGAFLAGCYNFVPVERPSPGTTVRIEVPLRSAVSDPNRAPETLEVEGTLLSAGDSIVMVTETRRELGTFRVLMETDTLRVARSGILGVEEQVFSRRKTFGLTALVLAGATGVVLAALEAAVGERGSGRPGDPTTQGGIRVSPLVLRDLLGALIR